MKRTEGGDRGNTAKFGKRRREGNVGMRKFTCIMNIGVVIVKGPWGTRLKYWLHSSLRPWNPRGFLMSCLNIGTAVSVGEAGRWGRSLTALHRHGMELHWPLASPGRPAAPSTSIPDEVKSPVCP